MITNILVKTATVSRNISFFLSGAAVAFAVFLGILMTNTEIYALGVYAFKMSVVGFIFEVVRHFVSTRFVSSAQLRGITMNK